MREYQFCCQKCGQVWYATDKDIKQSKSLSRDLHNAKTLRNMNSIGSMVKGKKYFRRSEQIAQMQAALTDPERCPGCGSRQADITEAQEVIEKHEHNGINSFLIALSILFMPYLGFFLVLIKKPFSRKANIGSMIYCALMSSMVFATMFSTLSNRENIGNNTSEQTSSISASSVEDSEEIGNKASEQTSSISISGVEDGEENSNIIRGFYKIEIEDSVKKLYSEGLDFSTLNYLQSDSMDCGLWTCSNTYAGKMTKKEHTYTARVGHNRLYNYGQAKLFYLAIDGETIFWDEDNEDTFFKVVGE